MRHWKKIAPLTAFVLAVALYVNQIPTSTQACMEDYMTPIFTYNSTPDVPFDGFLDGKLGILKPDFGVKLLALAYRQSNGASFSADEKHEIKLALAGTPPEDDGKELNKAIKNWIAAREKIGGKNEADIYTDRGYGGYNFFPNCAKNAFETATETLESRALSNGSDDANVREWLRGQDIVFKNCGATSSELSAVSPNAPEWLKKDRAYQIAAAKFYSLDSDGAIADFRRIADDSDSVWRETADYLVLRTMVRKASLEDEEKRSDSLAKAEDYAQGLLGRTSRYYGATTRLLGLIRYRTKPQERFEELSRSVAAQTNSDNLRQDLIDFQWLFDKFAGEATRAEMERREAAEMENRKHEPNNASNAMGNAANAAANAANMMGGGAAVNADTNYNYPKSNPNRDETTAEKPILVSFYINQNDTWESYQVAISPETSEPETFALFEAKIRRRLNQDERQQVAAGRISAIKDYEISISNNSKVAALGEEHEYYNGALTDAIVPETFRRNEMTDWIVNFQINGDINAFAYAVQKFSDTKSDLWLASALVKADKDSANIEYLLREGLSVSRASPLFPTIFYNVLRIKIEQGKFNESRKMLDDKIFNDIFGNLPISTQNEFAGLRMKTAANLSEFLNYAKRRPSAFSFPSGIGSIDSVIKAYDELGYKDESGNLIRGENVFVKEKLWQNRLMFDSDSAYLLNNYLPIKKLAEIGKGDHQMPDYLRDRLISAAWVRALLLKNSAVIAELAPLMIQRNPAMKPTVEAVLQAQTPAARQTAVTYHLLKFPVLTPLIEYGMGKTDDFEEPSQWAENWWCSSSFIEYDEKYEPKPISASSAPSFLNPLETKQAVAEVNALGKIPNGVTFLTQQVFEIANTNPRHPQLPEMLYIVAVVNQWNKYGCYVEDIEQYRSKAIEILQKRYPRSSWRHKIEESADK